MHEVLKYSVFIVFLWKIALVSLLHLELTIQSLEKVTDSYTHTKWTGCDEQYQLLNESLLRPKMDLIHQFNIQLLINPSLLAKYFCANPPVPNW